MRVRRVVTGQTATGDAVVSDTAVEPITVQLMPGSEFFYLWGSDTVVTVPTSGEQPAAPSWYPPVGGFRFGMFTLAPQSAAAAEDIDLAAAMAEVQQKLPGVIEQMDPAHPDRHATNSVDFVVVLSGEAWLELDNGERTLLRAGDTVVQNGTRHAWHNASDQPCVMAAVLVGANRAGSELD